MGRYALSSALILLIPVALLGAGRNRDDEPAQEGPFDARARDVLRDAIEEATELDGYSMFYSAGGLGYGGSWDVRGRGETTIFAGDPQVYANGERYVTPTDRGLAAPEEVSDIQGIRACLAVQPHVILEQLQRLSNGAEWETTEVQDYDNRPCRVILVSGDGRTAMAQIESVARRPQGFREGVARGLGMLDVNRTSTTYRVYVEAEASRLVRVYWQVVPGVPTATQDNSGSMMGGEGEMASTEGMLSNFQLTYDLTWRGYEPTEDFDIPEDVRRALRIRD